MIEVHKITNKKVFTPYYFRVIYILEYETCTRGLKIEIMYYLPNPQTTTLLRQE